MSGSGGNVPVGTATVAGYSVTALGAVAAVLTLILPDVDQQQVALIASVIVSFGAFVVTQVGRFQQAKALAQKPVSAAPTVDLDQGKVNEQADPGPFGPSAAEVVAAKAVIQRDKAAKARARR